MSAVRRGMPWFDVTALLHEGAEREPEAVEDGEVVGNARSSRRTIGVVLDVPFEWREARDEKQDDADANVGEDDAHPDLVREWIHERKHSRILFGWLLHVRQSNNHIRRFHTAPPLNTRLDKCNVRNIGEIMQTLDR